MNAKMLERMLSLFPDLTSESTAYYIESNATNMSHIYATKKSYMFGRENFLTRILKIKQENFLFDHIGPEHELHQV